MNLKLEGTLILNAHKARQIAEQKYASEIDDVLELIEHAAKQGKFSVTRPKPLSDFLVKVLMDRDFAITKNQNWEDVITW